MISPQFSTKFNTLRWRQRELQLTRSLLRAEGANAEALKKRAIILSSGPFTTLMQKAMARAMNKGLGLYSRASPLPPADPSIINAQASGWDALRNHWQTRVVIKPDGTSVTLWNSSGHAKYFQAGTRLMMVRPILPAVVAAEAGARLQRMARAKSAALKV
jgi:hypothetical protein